MADEIFKTQFKLLTNYDPFPWQIELFENWFVKSKFPGSCNLPTGLGKTSVIAIWLIALMNQPEKMPRRLVYVVNRRTVVDQTTDEVEKLRENLLKLENRPEHVRQLSISTLRGQFADNHEWSADPSLPAVICGTVDMIGSRLLFSGYGIGFKTKPLHAGFLGQDVLLVHDEAHLEPAFQTLVVAIEKEQERERERSNQMPWPNLCVMALSATSRGNGTEGQKEKSFELTDDEKNPPDVIPNPSTKPIHDVWRRLKAKKGVNFHPVEPEKGSVAKKIAALAADYKDKQSTVLIFVQTLEDIETVERELKKTKRPIVLLTGTMRGRERDQLVQQAVFKRFLKGAGAGETVYLVCTSAGEVGIDISAEHMVCDLSPFERMAQRLGRVNRYGCGDAKVDVVYPRTFDEKDKLSPARQKTLAMLQRLPQLPEQDDETNVRRWDVSPNALGGLRGRNDLPYKIEEAFTPQPAILPATDILFDAWALTTIRGKLPGRPPVEPYLHGISEWQPPETQVAWREEVWELRREFTDEEDRKEFQEFAAELLEDYPLKPHELLRDSTFRKHSGIRDKLLKLAEKNGELPVWIQESDGSVIATMLSKVADFPLASRTVILPPEAGGLKIGDGSSAGLFDESDYVPEHRDLYDVADMWEDDKGPLRKRIWKGDDESPNMMLVREIKFETLEDENAEAEKVWRWFVRKPEAANERSRRACLLQPHLDEVKDFAFRIVRGLRLSNDVAKAVANAIVLAASFHDLGKKRVPWQHSIGNDDPNEVYAKSGLRDGRPSLRPREFLKDYRHEFGSVLDLQHARNGSQPPVEFAELSEDMKDLVLHLVAAHHGRARPHFPVDLNRDPPLNEAFDPTVNDRDAATLAIETPRRFARLQRKYGRWGLAYLESLVRAADYAASATLGKTVDASAKAEDHP